jgi:hypothetical protein
MGLYEIVVGDIELLRVSGRSLRKLEQTLLRGAKLGSLKKPIMPWKSQERFQ